MIFHISKHHKSELVKEQITEKHIIINDDFSYLCQTALALTKQLAAILHRALKSAKKCNFRKS